MSGVNGVSGASGASGVSGVSGASGASGVSGASGEWCEWLGRHFAYLDLSFYSIKAQGSYYEDSGVLEREKEINKRID